LCTISGLYRQCFQEGNPGHETLVARESFGAPGFAGTIAQLDLLAVWGIQAAVFFS
jgi:hypothetical protein